MHQYIRDVRDAAERLIDGIYYERAQIDDLGVKLQQLESTVAEARDKANFLDMNPDLDDEGLGTLHRWTDYFTGSEMSDVEGQVLQLETAVGNREVSIRALSMSLLQIAKQGVSQEFGPRRDACPNDGRTVGNQPLRIVVWEARNQSIHSEEGSFHLNVVACFAQLEQDFGAAFSLSQHPHRNLAFEVVQLLGWNSFQAFANDLDSLLTKN